MTITTITHNPEIKIKLSEEKSVFLYFPNHGGQHIGSAAPMC